jgi:hypothetical protein
MSCRNESDHYEVTDAVFRMARSSKTVVDNYHATGIAANVDIQTGELGGGIRGAWGTVVDGNKQLGKLLAFNLRRTIEDKYAPLEVNSLCK